MGSPRAFERELKVATAGLEPDAIAKLLAMAARQALAEAQGAGEAPEQYVRSVNGRLGAPEESVVAPGPIVYSFNWLPQVATFALAFAEERSPVRSGAYKGAWFAMVDGARTEDFEAIPLGAELIITNDEPYSRKIETGHMHMRVPPGIVQDTRQAVLRKFGDVIRAEERFISLAGAYELRAAGGKRHRRRAIRHRELSYPALVVTSNF